MAKRAFITFILAVITASFGCGGGAEEPEPSTPPQAAPAAPSGQGAVISGTVTFDGDVVPEATTIQMGADPNCARMHPDAPPMTEIVLVGEGGGLGNVFVWVKEGVSGASYPVPEEAVLLNQEGCLYKPHVFGVRAGQTVEILNSDETLHNIHAMPKNNKEFNIGQPVKGLKTEKVFDNVEVMVPFKCDVHKWMASYVGVVDHPFFAVTRSDGRFELEDLPAGDYVVEAWHEKYGTRELKVSVGAGETKAISFAFAE